MPSPLPLCAVLFDKDGTLVDAFSGWVALVKKLRPGLTTAEEQILGICGGTVTAGGIVASGTEDELLRALHRMEGPAAPAWDQFLPVVRHRMEVFFHENPPEVRPLGRVKDTFNRLKARGWFLGIATSDTYTNAFRDLRRHGAELVDYWATFDRLEHPKPHPESVHRFCAAVGTVAGQVAFVGDSFVDLGAARAAGCGLFVAVRGPTCPPEVLAAADRTVDSVDELPELLAAVNEGALR